MILHLLTGDTGWCDDPDADEEATEDPREATCEECLKRAAAFGAAAAMRYAAVEAGVTRDPELVKERDEALRQLNAMCDALETQRAFFCTGCTRLFPVAQRGLNVQQMSWCADCAPHSQRVIR